MPADDGLRFDNCTEEDVGPAGPEGAEGGPEEAVARIQGWPGSFALEHGVLLPQSEDLQGGLASGTEENTECTQDGYEELDHELTVVARGADSMPRPAQPLISRSDEVLTTYTTRITLLGARIGIGRRGARCPPAAGSLP